MSSVLLSDQVRTGGGGFCHIRRMAIFSEEKVCEPIWNVVQVYAVIRGCIMPTQLLFWTICLVKTALAACYKSPVPSESKFSAEMFIELMGDLNHRADVQAAFVALKKIGVLYTKCKTGSEDNVELGAPLKHV